MNAEIAASLRTVLHDKEALWEVGRRAVEDALVELRDAGISVMGPGNGFTVNSPDGSPGPMRMSTFDGLRIALEAMAEHYESAAETKGRS